MMNVLHLPAIPMQVVQTFLEVLNVLVIVTSVAMVSTVYSCARMATI